MSDTLATIIDRVRLIVQDIPQELDQEIERQVQRAQKDAEDFWDQWPCLDAQLSFTTKEGQSTYTINNIVGAFQEQSKRWIRWRQESSPAWYDLADFAKQEVPTHEMSWSVGAFAGADAAGGSFPEYETADIRESAGILGFSGQLGPPRTVAPTEDGAKTEAQIDVGGARPSRLYVFPRPDKDNYAIVIPVQIRQPTLQLGILERNYWSETIPRFLENSAAANTLKENQDPRQFIYADNAATELAQLKRRLQRRQVHVGDGIVPRMNAGSTRHELRLR